MTSEQEFISFVAGIMEVPPASITLATAYESLPEWDSVMHLRLTLEIGEKYGVDIPVDEIAGVKTLGEFYVYLNGGDGGVPAPRDGGDEGVPAPKK